MVSQTEFNSWYVKEYSKHINKCVMTWVAFDFLLTRAMCQLDLELHLESPYNLQSPLRCINQISIWENLFSEFDIKEGPQDIV